ncbi:MAG: hypothetical protein U9R03_02165 [Candidatus Aerophobetes bacterium]|nr:hypothetical protein [Candidatus Aerophobetes bacterium]
MKKSLLVMMVLTAMALIFAGTVFAGEVSTSGAVEFQVSGTSAEGEVSGLFDEADTDAALSYSFSLDEAPWTAGITATFELVDTDEEPEGWKQSLSGAYITYDAEMMELTMNPLGIDYGLYDLYAYGELDEEGDPSIDGAPNIPENAGVKVFIPFEATTLTAVVNNQEDDGELAFNYGVGFDYAMESLTFGLMANSTPVAGATWYGTSYGLKLVYDIAPTTFTGEYGSFSPSGEKEEGSGYYGKLAYAMDAMGDLSLSYAGADENFNGAGDPTDHAYAKIEGEWSYPATEDTTLTLIVTSEDTGLAEAEAVTSYEGMLAKTLAENVTLTLDVSGDPDVTEYYAKMGVSF